ncbi:hypothetical protein HDU97_006476 [Phlyctochytrium planicorne]|nr:hypothetical protein HDU97_006476 [Phlyctochytrium planicorne]
MGRPKKRTKTSSRSVSPTSPASASPSGPSKKRKRSRIEISKENAILSRQQLQDDPNETPNQPNLPQDPILTHPAYTSQKQFLEFEHESLLERRSILRKALQALHSDERFLMEAKKERMPLRTWEGHYWDMLQRQKRDKEEFWNQKDAGSLEFPSFSANDGHGEGVGGSTSASTSTTPFSTTFAGTSVTPSATATPDDFTSLLHPLFGAGFEESPVGVDNHAFPMNDSDGEEEWEVGDDEGLEDDGDLQRWIG